EDPARLLRRRPPGRHEPLERVAASPRVGGTHRLLAGAPGRLLPRARGHRLGEEAARVNAVLVHAGVAIAAIVAYTVLTALGHDGDVVLAAGLAYGSGAGIQRAVGSK